jgi:ribonuclease Y
VTTIIVAVVAVVATLLIAVPITSKVSVDNKVKKDAETIGSAEEKARGIIDEALKTAETKKRETLLEVKEESLRTKNELEKETKERRNELQKYEKRVLAKEETVDKKAEAVEKREAECTARFAELQKKEKRVDELELKGVQELERVSGLTSEQAKEELLKSVEDDVKVDVARLYKELESQAKEEAGKKAKEYVVNAIQKCAVDHVAETTISVVQLPSDEMKGRIIGREGRNIRTMETLTGVDLIIDDTPEAVVLSSFDPIRREVARVALEKLIVDGRIHPARIEEMVEKAQKEVENQIREDGENAAMDVGVHGIHPELLKLLGRMKFRSSYGQNALKHSIEVAQLSGLLAGEIGVDVRMAKRAGLLHDIGRFEQIRRFHSFEPGTMDHAVFGAELLFGEEKLIRRFVEDDKFDELIDAAIRKHSDFKLEGIHDARTLFHAKLIRDADKLDNCRVKLEASVEAMLGVSEKDAGEGLISPAVWESCLRRESVLSADRHVPVDYWVSYLAQYYDINFPETCEIIEEEDYITRIAGRLTYQEQDTRTKLHILTEDLNRYLEMPAVSVKE